MFRSRLTFMAITATLSLVLSVSSSAQDDLSNLTTLEAIHGTSEFSPSSDASLLQGLEAQGNRQPVPFTTEQAAIFQKESTLDVSKSEKKYSTARQNILLGPIQSIFGIALVVGIAYGGIRFYRKSIFSNPFDQVPTKSRRRR